MANSEPGSLSLKGRIGHVPDPGQCGVARLFDNLEIPDLDTGNGEVAGSSRWGHVSAS